MDLIVAATYKRGIVELLKSKRKCFLLIVEQLRIFKQRIAIKQSNLNKNIPNFDNF